MIRIIDNKGNVKYVSEAVAKSGYLKSYGYKIEDLNVNHSKFIEPLTRTMELNESIGVINEPEFIEPEKKKAGRPKKTDN